MSNNNKNGTLMFCPYCKGFQFCKAIPDGTQRVDEWIGHSVARWFHRGRECQTCSGYFPTGEIHENQIRELIEYRKVARSAIELRSRFDKMRSRIDGKIRELYELFQNLTEIVDDCE